MVKADKTDTRSSLSIIISIEIQRNYSKSLSTQSTRSGFPSSMMQGFNPQSIFHLGCIWCGSHLLKCDIAFGFVRGNRAHSYRQPTWKVHSSVHDKNCISDQHQEFMQKQTHHRIRWWRWLWAEELFWVTLPDWSTGKKQREVMCLNYSQLIWSPHEAHTRRSLSSKHSAKPKKSYSRH